MDGHGESKGADYLGERLRRLWVESGGFPADREVMLTWAALLCERVGIVQDVQLPHTVLQGASHDLDDILTIAGEYDGT